VSSPHPFDPSAELRTGLAQGRSRTLRNTAVFSFTLLAIEFLDESVFGPREAAWPLIRMTWA